MYSWLKPDYIVKSLFDIPIKQLKSKQIEGLIIDLDNTLTHWNVTTIDEKIWKWLKTLEKEGFKICIVSNNSAKRINASLTVRKYPFVSNALKPGKKSFLKAIKLMGTTKDTTAVIGDQLFTDILGGKRLGLLTVLVTPLSQREFWGTKIMRKFEKIFLSKYK